MSEIIDLSHPIEDGMITYTGLPAHTILLRAEIPIVEHMCNLGSLPVTGFKFFAVPAPVKGMGSFPVRAFAILE